MKVCLIGHFNDNLDEGVRNVGKSIAKELESQGIEVKKINFSSFFCWKEAIEFHPDIIHFVLSPTLIGIIFAKFISIMNYKSKTLISAIHSSIPKWKLLKLFKPDLVLVQSEDTEKIFDAIGFKTEFLPNGVDIDKFKPVDFKTKHKLREKFGIPPDKFVVLHLASLTKERNLDVLIKCQEKEGNQVLIIGREKENFDKDVVNKLQRAGCIVWVKHFSNIEEIYNLSDCYVFPTINKRACIETPLSVLEAMSCNIPIVTTKFGSLNRILKHNEDVFFVDNDKEFNDCIELIKNKEIRTREKVITYSWKNVVLQIRKNYERLLCRV
jgi:glycosyltransferase involved in cell wall biosynthesis